MFVNALSLLVLAGTGLVAATPNIQVRDVCSSGVYSELVPILKGYPVAQQFCAAFYPLTCSGPKLKRAASVTRSTASSKSTTTTKSNSSNLVTSKAQSTSTTARISIPSKTTTTTATGGAQVSAWAKCLNQGSTVVATICSCIQGVSCNVTAIW